MLLIPLAQLLSYIAIATAALKVLEQLVRRHDVSVLFAGIAYFYLLVAVPWLVFWFVVRWGFDLVLTEPVLQSQSWDVGLALTTYAAMIVSYLVGIMLICVAVRRLARAGEPPRA